MENEDTLDYLGRWEESHRLAGSWEAYAEANDEARFSRDLVAKFTLPGHARMSRVSCGQYRILGDIKDDHGMMRKVKWSCHSRHCEICWGSWCTKLATKSTRRMMAGVQKIGGRLVDKPRQRQLMHMVVSLPEDCYEVFKSREGRKELRAAAIERLFRVMDVPEGGMMVDHAYRFSPGLKSARYSPHFHFVVSGYFDMDKNNEIWQKEKGFLVKYIDTLPTDKDVWNCVRYMLSHSTAVMDEVGVKNTEHTVRYFGLYGYNKLSDKVQLSAVADPAGGVLDLVQAGAPKQEVELFSVGAVQYDPRYKQSEWKYHGTAAGIHNVGKLVSKAVDSLKDYPAIAKSKHYCYDCDVEMYGGTVTKTVTDDSVTWEASPVPGGPREGCMEVDDEHMREICIPRRHDVYEWKEDEPRGYGKIPDNTQIHIRFDYHTKKGIKKSRFLVVTMDPSEDMICDICKDVFTVLHYIGPPDPDFFKAIPDEAKVVIPPSRISEFVEMSTYRADCRVEGVRFAGMPYFNIDGVWDVDYGEMQYPGVRYTSALHGVIHRRVLWSKYKEYERKLQSPPSRVFYGQMITVALSVDYELTGEVGGRDIGMYRDLLDDYKRAVIGLPDNPDGEQTQLFTGYGRVDYWTKSLWR